jgi:hypothetical protein
MRGYGGLVDEVVVRQVVARTSNHLHHVVYRDEAGHVEHLQITGVHPFWVEGRGWVEAADLRPGMTLGDLDGTGGGQLTVESNVREEHPEGVAVYNFEVAGDHTYLVADGQGEEAWAWVHNANYSQVLRDRGADPLGRTGPGKYFENTGYLSHGHHAKTCPMNCWLTSRRCGGSTSTSSATTAGRPPAAGVTASSAPYAASGR